MQGHYTTIKWRMSMHSKLLSGSQVVVLPRESAKDEFRVYVLLDVVYIDQPHQSTRRYYEVRWMSCHGRVTILLADPAMGHGLDGARGTSNIFYVHTLVEKGPFV